MDYSRYGVGGFTLIELLVTLTVAAILLTIGVPNLRAFLTANQISTQTNELLGDLAYARSEAARQGLRVFICGGTGWAGCAAGATPAWAQGWQVIADSDRNGAINVADTVLRIRQPLPTGFTLNLTGGSDVNNLWFRSSGASNAGSGSFRLCFPKQYGYDLALSTTGQVVAQKMTSACP